MSLGELVVDQIIKKETRRFIEYAQGTCQSVSEILDVLDIPDENYIDWQTVDDEIFHCDDCSWWCEIGDMKDDGVCDDCTMMTTCDQCYGDFHSDELHEGRFCDECYEEQD